MPLLIIPSGLKKFERTEATTKLVARRSLSKTSAMMVAVQLETAAAQVTATIAKAAHRESKARWFHKALPNHEWHDRNEKQIGSTSKGEVPSSSEMDPTIRARRIVLIVDELQFHSRRRNLRKMNALTSCFRLGARFGRRDR